MAIRRTLVILGNVEIVYKDTLLGALRSPILDCDMATHPQKYAAYAFVEVGGNLQKLDVEWKDPKEGEVIVKVLACGVCGRYTAIFSCWEKVTLILTCD